jgi:large subunit ribosomal protein L25
MVPVNTIATAVGQKEGGSLQLVRNELEVLCLPTQVPQSIDIDVTELQIGDTIHIEDIAVPEGVEFVYDVNFTVLTLSVIKVEVEKTEEEDALEVEEAPAEDEEAAE